MKAFGTMFGVEKLPCSSPDLRRARGAGVGVVQPYAPAIDGPGHVAVSV